VTGYALLLKEQAGTATTAEKKRLRTIRATFRTVNRATSEDRHSEAPQNEQHRPMTPKDWRRLGPLSVKRELSAAEVHELTLLETRFGFDRERRGMGGEVKSRPDGSIDDPEGERRSRRIIKVQRWINARLRRVAEKAKARSAVDTIRAKKAGHVSAIERTKERLKTGFAPNEKYRVTYMTGIDELGNKSAAARRVQKMQKKDGHKPNGQRGIVKYFDKHPSERE
jgi:hypothetical protein